MKKSSIYKALEGRILILDGGLGTLIQQRRLTEEDYRGVTFAGWGSTLKGCSDVLALSSPDVILGVHEAYLKAGADILSTDTFNANAISLADYSLQEYAYRINRAAGELARRAADKATADNPDKPRFVAGSMGPTNRSASMSPDVADPGARSVTFEQLQAAYSDQARGLIDGGVDLFLVETVFDTLNAKAALRAIETVCAEKNVVIPVMVSGTVSDNSGRILSGQTVEAFYASVAHAPNLLSVGLNCAFGAEQLHAFLSRLARVSGHYVSAHPNAGLPNVTGGYDQTPEMMVEHIAGYLKEGLLNIVGGCCGTTPEHIALIARLAAKHAPRTLPAPRHETTLSGLEPLVITPQINFVNIGERTNVAGSAKFARLIREGQYEEALAVARQQVEAGAQVIDVCMDDGMIDGVAAMTHFLNMVASEPDVARVPVMIDSSKWEVLEAGLRCTQGKSVVNSISLKEGQAEFLHRAATIHSYGAAAVVMLFDERGQADTFERKIEVAGRAYKLLTDAGFPAEDIIFDPNVLAVATGIEQHNDYGVAFIEATRWIKENLPYAKVSGGVSNLSFALRGNNAVREAMHSVFLYHAIAAGMDMGIVNPAMLQIYTDIPEELLELTEDAVLNRRADAAERLTAYAVRTKGETDASVATAVQAWRAEPVGKRIEHAMLKGVSDHVQQDVLEAYAASENPLTVIETLLMPSMDKVGELFAAGKMFLPQVIKSARVMKTAVGALLPYIEGGSAGAVQKAGKILIATVKGDVHDIGKNIVSVVMSCNGYQIHDLGVMVDPEKIVHEASQWGADAIGLSGLITPSLEEMIKVVDMMEHVGMHIPVIIGGATTSQMHTAVMIAPRYSGVVVHVNDASDNIRVLSRLLGARSSEYIKEIKAKQGRLRTDYARSRNTLQYVSLATARHNRSIKQPQSVILPKDIGRVAFRDYAIQEVVPYIDWRFFFPAWGIKGQYPQLLDSPDKGEEARKLLRDAQTMLQHIMRNRLLQLHAAVAVLPASSVDDDILVPDEFGNKVRLAQLRNQEQGEGKNLCLSDYVLAEQVVPTGDFVGMFAVTAGAGLDALVASYREAGDDYNAIMCKLLADRLTEALAEVMHGFVRRSMWGFEKEGEVTPEQAIRGKYRGIRVAFGYPACPDHSLKKEVFRLMQVSDVLPMKLTENYMISPGESLCGLIFADQDAAYFGVGHIDEQQLADYAARRSMSVEEVKRLMPNNI